MRKTYKEFIKEQLTTMKQGEPIYTKDLAERMSDEYGLSDDKARAAVSVAMARILSEKDEFHLRFYKRGIYYLTNFTPFGETGIDTEALIRRKYIDDDNGYESGLTLLNKIGLTTQLPKKREFVSNNATDCIREDKDLGVMVRPPKEKITKDNKDYLRYLDILDMIGKAPIDVREPYTLLADFLRSEGLEYGKLLALANKFYPHSILLKLANVAEAGEAA